MLQCDETNELMLDWLYEELDDERSSRVADHVSACPQCTAEIGSLRRTRQLFRDLPDYEPPAAVSAILLHEAAKRAPAAKTSAATEGLWSRFRTWLQPLVMHPAAAAVATLVLVAGVAGTLYVRSGGQVSKTAPNSELASAPTSPAAMASGEREGLEGAVPGAMADESPEPVSPAQGVTAGLLDQNSQDEVERQAAEAAMEREVAERAVAQKKLFAEKPAPSKSRGKKSSKAPMANAISGSDPLIDSDLDGFGFGATANSAPSSAGKGSGGGDTYRAYKDERSADDDAWLKEKKTRLSRAAADKKCREAAAIANDIMDRNRDFYATEVERTKAVTSCSWYVQDESRRRATARAQQGAGSGSGAQADKAKKAAPARDQAEVLE